MWWSRHVWEAFKQQYCQATRRHWKQAVIGNNQDLTNRQYFRNPYPWMEYFDLDLCFTVFLKTHVEPKWILKRLYSRHVTSHHLNHVDPDVWCQMASCGLYEFRNTSVSSCLFCRIRIIYLMVISSRHLDMCILHWYFIAVSRTITKSLSIEYCSSYLPTTRRTVLYGYYPARPFSMKVAKTLVSKYSL